MLHLQHIRVNHCSSLQLVCALRGVLAIDFCMSVKVSPALPGSAGHVITQLQNFDSEETQVPAPFCGLLESASCGFCFPRQKTHNSVVCNWMASFQSSPSVGVFSGSRGFMSLPGTCNISQETYI